ncbi:YbjN domain-containing protein [Brevundimonas sp. A19_0]|uniref:YbjN domain-containing protein n=1 Tax=Brevundimonas sp. A19_0 TaxID=2821087 RepID=UPI001ADC60C4|nr:YbjN domain-containing protein [Brevundimonas sp. A19_0]MBO9502293.1 YbjN domain-containing protein [Brevundimonas sp. A19_0]
MFTTPRTLAALAVAPLLLMAAPSLAATDPGTAPAARPAAQDPVLGLTPAEVRAWLIEKGATVAVPRTIEGETIEGEAFQGQTVLQVNDGSTNWLIFFYGCDATGRCQDIQFAANIVADGLSLDRINAWNREQRFVKGYLQMNPNGTNAAVLQFDVLLQPGLGVEQMNDPTVVWLELLARFIESLIAPTNEVAPAAPVTLPTTGS